MLNIFQYRNGLQILPVTSLSLDEMGELQVLLSDGKLYYHNGTTFSPLVTEAGSTIITNKNLVDNSTFIIDVVDNTIRIGFNAGGTTGTTTTIASSQTVNRVITLPDATDTLVGKATSDTLTNKSIDGNTNTITNISLTAGVTGTLGITSGGTGQTTQQASINALTGAQISGRYLRSDGTNSTLSILLASDLSGTVSISNGGTGQSSKTAAFDALSPMTTAGDLIIGGTAGSGIRLPATSNGFILTLSGGSPVWAANAGGSAVQTIGVIDSQSKSANGLVISGTSIVAQTADASFPGMVSITTQTFLGIKTFSTSIKTPTLNDNGAGLTIQPALNQNLTLNTTGAGRVIINGAEGLDMGEQGTPSNPASGFSSLFFKTNHLLYSVDSTGTERLIGSGGGSGGVNFVTLDTTFSPVKSDNFNAENSVGDWITYNDGAVAVPTDMTGGSATSLTLSRTTTVGEVLDGSGSFKIVKTATNAQGQGTSVVANIPLGYRGRRAVISMPFKIISGSLVSGDLKMYAYDVTNSVLLTPQNNNVFSTGTLSAAFDIPATCAQIRFGFHFATTSTAAVTFTFDDVSVGPQSNTGIVSTGELTDWVQFDMQVDATTTAPTKGTTTVDKAYYRRVGDSIEIRWDFEQTASGSNGSGTYLFRLPNGYSIDTTKQPLISSLALGDCIVGIGAWNNSTTAAFLTRMVAYDATHLVAQYQNTDSSFVSISDGAGFGSAWTFTFTAKVPISGWSSNTVVANSGILTMSSILANGTRVTTTPTQLGEYRSQLRTANTYVFTDTNGAPAIPPSVANGILLYAGNQFNTADTNNEPTRYEIFVGKNKVVEPSYYKNTGRTGYVFTDNFTYNGGRDYGVQFDYDEVTGIAIVEAFRFLGGTFVHSSGLAEDGLNVDNVYFDLTVANNAFQIQLAGQQSEILVTAGNGVGSTNTSVRRFTNVRKNLGSAITYVDSASLGGSFTINESGVYTITYNDGKNVPIANAACALTKNATGTQLTGNPESQTSYSDVRLGFVFNGFPDNLSGPCLFIDATINCQQGDIIRAHSVSGLTDANEATTQFRITKVS